MLSLSFANNCRAAFLLAIFFERPFPTSTKLSNSVRHAKTLLCGKPSSSVNSNLGGLSESFCVISKRLPTGLDLSLSVPFVSASGFVSSLEQTPASSNLSSGFALFIDFLNN